MITPSLGQIAAVLGHAKKSGSGYVCSCHAMTTRTPPFRSQSVTAGCCSSAMRVASKSISLRSSGGAAGSIAPAPRRRRSKPHR